jgi:hypothetical protein
MTREESENTRDLLRLVVLQSHLGMVRSLLFKLVKSPNAIKCPECGTYLAAVEAMREEIRHWIDRLGNWSAK